MACDSWICCRQVLPGTVRFCPSCRTDRLKLRHSSKAVVYRNPATGEIRIPPRADQPVPEVYSRQGYVREEIEHMPSFERQTGFVHEASNYSSGSGGAERDTTSHCDPLPIKGLDDPDPSSPPIPPDV